MALARDSRGAAPAVQGDPGFGEAAERVYDAGQALIVRRLELAMSEACVLARSAVGFVVVGVIVFAGWLYLVAGLIDALARDYPRFGVEMSVGGFHLALGAALLGVFQRAVGKLGDRT